MLNKCIWFLGLSGAGKTTLAEGLSDILKNRGKPVIVLDGDELRKGLNKNLGFSAEDRKENVRRTAEVARLFIQEGYWVVVALITPFESMRESNRQILGKQYIEVYVDSPLNLCQIRDPKGLYAKILNEGLQNFTGIDSPFEIPIQSDITLNTEDQCVHDSILELLKKLDLEWGI